MSHRHHLRPRIRLHPFAAAGLFLLFFAAPRAYAFSVLSCVILHELGHLAAATLFGRTARSICLMPTGMRIELPPPRTYAEELIVAMAGPLMNLLWMLLFRALPSAVSLKTAELSLALAILNLLPITGFDGGHIVHALTALVISDGAAQRFLQLTTSLCLAVMWMLSLYVFFYSGVNVMLLIFCAYLFSFLIVKKL